MPIAGILLANLLEGLDRPLLLRRLVLTLLWNSVRLTVAVTLLCAVIGVAAPFGLGIGAGAALGHDMKASVFLGAALTATSVGITARVLKDLGRIASPEGQIILGAAVIDDVLGLLILAVVSGIISAANAGAEMSYGDIGITLLFDPEHDLEERILKEQFDP